ncbi:BA75_02594T0 [Komagataella pastoris]|uniref:BA75_02594T0 n=1 Tax=Komagataella pastoris TaxID=4922 RepID=A0A1B2JD21_PICPA|nr:BA75_02594T0 [Komagataella pastoris]
MTPPQVLQLLKSAKYIHLGTSADDIPHVSLMNYTYVSPEEVLKEGFPLSDSSHSVIILTTDKDTVKYNNMRANPSVSILVHDWVTKTNSIEAGANHLLSFLKNLNQNELVSTSATLAGKAHILSDEKQIEYYKKKHLENNPEGKVFIDGDNVAIVLVQVLSSKVADTENNVSEYNS